VYVSRVPLEQRPARAGHIDASEIPVEEDEDE
jgi:hypothetical protein